VRSMNYEVSLIIDESLDVVSNLYIDKAAMLIWEKGLKRVEDREFTLFQQGSSGILVFVFGFNEQEMHMKVSVVKNELPHSIDLIYEVPGAWNLCKNTFESMDNKKTRWTMDVLFRFEQPMGLPLEAFIKKTEDAMNLFKAFVEHRK